MEKYIRKKEGATDSGLTADGLDVSVICGAISALVRLPVVPHAPCVVLHLVHIRKCH